MVRYRAEAYRDHSPASAREASGVQACQAWTHGVPEPPTPATATAATKAPLQLQRHGKCPDGRVHFTTPSPRISGPQPTGRPLTDNVRIGLCGRITAGDSTGWFVEVVDDTDATGGYLILVHEDRDRSGKGYDSWVDSLAAVAGYFTESGWQVDWPQNPAER